MKVGHSSYGYYGDYNDFLAIGRGIHVINHDLGYLGYASDAEGVYNLLQTVGDYNRDDVIEVVNMAVNNMQEEKPFNE